jgi:hypothetical protein
VHSHYDGISANGTVIDGGAGVDVGWILQCSVRTLGQGQLGAVRDNNEIGSGQIAAPCTFRREGREADFRCGLCQGPQCGHEPIAPAASRPISAIFWENLLTHFGAKDASLRLETGRFEMIDNWRPDLRNPNIILD